MQILLNGHEEIMEKQMNLVNFLLLKEMDLATIIVEYNGKIIKQQLWDGIVLQNNDRLEVLKFVGGG